MNGNCEKSYPNCKTPATEQAEFLKSELIWTGYYIDRNSVESITDKKEAITELKALNSTKELKSFLRSVQHLSTFVNSLSKKTDRMRRLLKKGVDGNGRRE